MLPEQQKAFDAFYRTAHNNRILDEKTTLMVHLAASMAVACYPCMRVYMEQAKHVGLTKEEIDTVETIVMAVSAGRVMLQFKEAMARKGGKDITYEPCEC